jgi:hypothetical protein
MSENNINISIPSHDLNLDPTLLKKMCFLYNALDSGWSIKKKDKSYIFTKKHEGKTQVFEETFLSSFMKDNFNFKNIIS